MGKSRDCDTCLNSNFNPYYLVGLDHVTLYLSSAMSIMQTNIQRMLRTETVRDKLLKTHEGMWELQLYSCWLVRNPHLSAQMLSF
jgi:hypothetical protein